MHGYIKTVIADHGYGFVEVAGRPDIFFHVNALARDLPFDERLIGLRVDFDEEPGREGKTRATKVRRAD